MLIVNRSTAASVLDYTDVISAVETAHGGLARGTAGQAERQNLEIPDTDILLVPMMAASAAHRAAGLKLLADSPANPGLGLPRQQSTILLIDDRTGRCEALLDGAAITLFRTAAASAVATKHLARSGASVLGLVGAGAQAWAHVQAIGHVRDLERVVVWSRGTTSAQAFVDRCLATGMDAVAAESPRQVVDEADVLCTLTPSVEPLVLGQWLHDGMHLNVVGSPPRDTHREIDSEVLRRARVVVDDRRVALAESGAITTALAEGAIVPADLGVELGDVIVGRPGRQTDADVTVYSSVGVGIQDVVTARLVVDALEKQGPGVGQHVDLTR